MAWLYIEKTVIRRNTFTIIASYLCSEDKWVLSDLHVFDAAEPCGHKVNWQSFYSALCHRLHNVTACGGAAQRFMHSDAE